MNRETLLAYYEKLTGLVGKLPGGLQKPILNELVPIRELFLEQRPPRLLLVGDPEPSSREFLLSLLSHEAAAGIAPAAASPVHSESGELLPPPLPALENGESDNGWRSVVLPNRGAVQILDAREPGLPPGFLTRALERHRPDVVVLFQGAGGMDAAHHFQETMDFVASIERIALPPALPEKDQASSAKAPAAPKPWAPALVGISTASGQPEGVERLRALLHSRRELAGWNLRVLPLGDAAGIATAICAFLPNPARLEFALFGDIRPAQVEIARSLLKSFTAVCGVIGMQPIPLADLPVLTTLQSLMVGLIAYVSGRRLGPRAIAEFFGAVGLSFGLGMIFREGARGIMKIVPGFGNAISGMVAGAGTYAIGRAAIAYFVERVPAPETRKLFQTIRPRRTTFLRRLPWKRKTREITDSSTRE